jgi:hypothetical protein
MPFGYINGIYGFYYSGGFVPKPEFEDNLYATLNNEIAYFDSSINPYTNKLIGYNLKVNNIVVSKSKEKPNKILWVNGFLCCIFNNRVELHDLPQKANISHFISGITDIIYLNNITRDFIYVKNSCIFRGYDKIIARNNTKGVWYEHDKLYYAIEDYCWVCDGVHVYIYEGGYPFYEKNIVLVC